MYEYIDKIYKFICTYEKPVNLYYRKDANELWVVIKDKTLEKTINIKYMLNEYMDNSRCLFHLFVLDETQLIVDEMPKWDYKI